MSMIDASGWEAVFESHFPGKEDRTYRHSKSLVFWLNDAEGPSGWFVDDQGCLLAATSRSNFKHYQESGYETNTITPAPAGWWVVWKQDEAPHIWEPIIGWATDKGSTILRAVLPPDADGTFDTARAGKTTRFVYDLEHKGGDGPWPGEGQKDEDLS